MFAIGQKVVCINGEWEANDGFPLTPAEIASFPKEDEVFTISGVFPDDTPGQFPAPVTPGTIFFSFDEIPERKEPGIYGQLIFNWEHFRPVIERKTDISVFENMLLPKAVERPIVTADGKWANCPVPKVREDA